MVDKKSQIKEEVKRVYADIATSSNSCCGVGSSCCSLNKNIINISEKLGYSENEVENVPDNSNLGLGCGNPQAIALINDGETVLDLGSGAGFDCFLASRQVGETGKVIGIDMTFQMVDKANENARKGNYSNVEFKLGEIENLPIEDNSVDVIISNCVINLSPDKQKVFDDSFRVLKKGGRFAVSDIISENSMTEEMKKDMESYSGCISGASSLEEVKTMLEKSGFKKIKIEPNLESKNFIKDWSSKYDSENFIVSASITATKPKLK